MADAEMTNNTINPEDLEDGEIESDCEDAKNDVEVRDSHETTTLDNQTQIQTDENMKEDEIYYSKSGKKKKSKNKDKSKDKLKKHSKRSSPSEDDFAGSIEKAIRKAMNKDDNESDEHEEVDERRKRKKKKKHDGKEGSSKKKKKQEYFEDVDENEMMCIRGASPLQKNSPQADVYDDDDSCASDSSQASLEFRQRQRPLLRKNKGDRRRGPLQDADGVCLYYMQGKCHKGDTCTFSHDAQPPRKMELCKFYLMDCCAKREKCLYMHSDFPCKFYHTGLPCIYNKEDCKFAHGKPLSEALRLVLLKHIESAPKEILGDFPRLSKGAATMIHNTQLKLMQEYGCEPPEPPENNIPSLFELNIPKPPNLLETTTTLLNNDKTSIKVRQSRWQNEEDVSSKQTSRQTTDIGKTAIDNLEQHKSSLKARHSRWQNEEEISAKIIDIPQHINVLSIRNLSGVLAPKQISDLELMGINNLEQLGQLTVLQLNSIGISLKQITEIQLNTMNIQKLGLISSNSESVLPVSNAGAKDLDLRIPPVAPVVTTSSTTLTGDIAGKDIDMRFQHPTPNIQTEDGQSNNLSQLPETRVNKDMIDIDQYTKDALKFAIKEKEYIDNDSLDNDSGLALQSKDIDQRVLKFVDNNDLSNVYNKTNDNFHVKKDDTDIRFLQPEPIFKNPSKNHRRSTTDDEDNNLLIDEKWYSSDEDKPLKPKSQSSSPGPMSPHSASQSQAIEPAAVLSKLGDLSQFAISDEVTQLLNKMKNNLQDSKSSEKLTENNVSSLKERSDPRTATKSSPEHKMNTLSKSSHKRAPKVSIYECIEGEPTDGRRRTDVDLRHKDFKLPAFGDTDLRSNTSGDIDLRLGLPFKPIPNYTPASEIDGSINSHPPIPYKVVIIDIPRPDYTDIRNSTSKSQALLDPRLRKVFRLSVDDSNSDSDKPTKPTVAAPRVDPRRKQKEVTEDKPALDLSTILQNSEWYKELSSTQKIYVNQNLASVTSMIKQHQQDKLSGNKLDLTSIQTNTVLVSIFANLGVSLNDNAEFSYMPKPKEGLLKTPVNYQGYGMPGSNFDSNNINMMNMNMGVVGPMNNMNIAPMPGYNHPDPRGGPAPGLLGVAPNVPHNFDNNFGGHNNFNNMPFNGTNNDFGNMNPEQNFQRFSNRGGGYRGRGNDRWNRGGGPRGHRDRKGYDRGGWKVDRL